MNFKTLNKLQHASDQNLLDIETAKQNGTKAIGFYCLYSPMEIAIAAGAIPLPLCGTRNDPIDAAEEVLPNNLCPLIKSSYGFAATDTCPFFRFSDRVVGDTTCDGKKKMFELLSEYKPMHILQLPQDPTSEMALTLWKHEVEQFRVMIENVTATAIHEQDLRSAVRLMNRERMAKKGLMDLLKNNPSPISGLDLLNVMFKTGFFADKKMGIALIEDLVTEIQENAFNGESSFGAHAPRILLTGVPVGIGCEKVVRIVEETGASVVCFENCSGYKQAYTVDESKDPILALSEQYLTTPCSVMSPNDGRFELLADLIPEFSVDGVIDLTWQACHTYNVESYMVGKVVKEKYGLPFLHLETDYSESDTEQLRVRIEAFLEMIR